MPWPDGFAAAVVGFVFLSCHKSLVGASLLAMNLRAPRGIRHAASSLTTIASSLLQEGGIPACDIGARAPIQSKQLIWHFNVVDCPGTTLYANRLHRPDPVDAGGRFAPDRTGDPAAVAAGANRRRGIACVADSGIACGPGSRVVPVSVPAAATVLRRLAHAQARILAPARTDPDPGGGPGVVYRGGRRLFHSLAAT
ncbi:hypothetical protein D3C75_467040 [compost metagenome]